MKPALIKVLLVCLAVLWPTLGLRAAVGVCNDNFPDGLQSHSLGQIDFGYNAQLQGSPDARLHAGSITSSWWSWRVPTCATVQCSRINANGPSQSGGTFPGISSNADVTVGYRETGTLNGNGTNRYQTVSVGSEAQLTINSGAQTFYIAQLQVGYRATLRLSPGDYWIGALSTGSESQIQVVGNGRVRLFVRDAPSLGYRSLYNSPAFESAGSPGKLFLYGYGNVTFETETTFSGYVYSQQDVYAGYASRLYGAITADDIELASNATVQYVAPTGSCAKPAELRLSWLLDEASWSGAAGEVKDASGNELVGRAINGATTAATSPALPAVDSQGTCGYGSFRTGSSQYVQAAHDDLLTLRDSFTIGLWVKPRSLPSSGLMSILSKDENYEFHLNPNGTVNWWWQTTGPEATVQFNSSKALTVGQWSHVLVRYAPGDQRIYINGVQAGSATFSGTPRANTDPLQLGWDQIAGRHFDGELDELRIYDGALSASEISALVAERHACGRRLQCFGDDFGSSLSNDWVVSSRGKTPFTPYVQNGRLRLTSNQTNVATATALQRLLPAQGNFIQVEFDYFAYNGSGADGIAVILSDATQTPQPGGFGGSLGYAQLNDNSNRISGFAGGWLGIALDEFGNFSNMSEGRVGGSPTRQTPDSVSIRGSGSGLDGYRYLTGTERSLSPGLDDARNRDPSPGHRYRLTIDARQSGQALVTVERNTGSGFEVLPNLNRYNVLATGNEQKAMPSRFYLSFTGSTGASTNYHDIDNLQVCATQIEPIGQQIHHFDLSYAPSSLTCNPQDVTIKACLNADCSKLYTDAVTVTLTSDTAVWHAKDNQVTFSGGIGTAKVQVTQVGEATIGVGGSTPPALSFGTTTCSTAGCKLTGVTSGFLFDVPTVIADKPVEVAFRAVEADKAEPQRCVAGFGGGTRSIEFSSKYIDPDNGTRSVRVNGTEVTATPKSLQLAFNDQAVATLTVEYRDAGVMQLNARYAPTSGYEKGLVMTGTDQFLSKPYGLCIEADAASEAACTADTVAGCGPYKSGPSIIRAGDVLPLRIRAVGWESDSELLTADNLCNANLTTPNFELEKIALKHQRTAPTNGVDGTLGIADYAHQKGESTAIQPKFSEVGIFTVTAAPPLYMGEAINGGTSRRIGRITPAYLEVTGSASLTPSCGMEYSYQGQPIAFAADNPPTLTVTGKNRQGAPTKNYDIGEFWRLAAPSAGAYSSITDRAGLNERLVTTGTATTVTDNATIGDGIRAFRWVGQTLTYTQAAVPGPDDLPITAKNRQTFSAASLTDADGACYGTAGCQAFSYDFTEAPGTEVRLGRLAIGNAHGSELQALALPVRVQTWRQPSGSASPLFLAEAADSCTTAGVVKDPVLDGFSGNLASGETAASVGNFAQGAALATLSAPGRGNDGSVRLSFPDVPEWLKYRWDGAATPQPPSGVATFGVYQGSPPLIFRREVYR
ncbi:DUF6701 domain-containing protein [Stutzerimonas urumqiensis]|uniref:DUF6701 domain-containing protein n=1 Tax=Stutzerimonas urumqiensis TaxID=638269 RepID=UPI000EAFA949|nr:DUF6701 domain-containing protein [Stutzerimonas urumqiensis]